MNKPLLISLAAAALLGTNLNAETMYEKFQAMELQMQEMKKEIATLKAQDADEEADSDEEVEAEEAETSDDSAEEEEDKEESDDDESEDDEDEDDEDEDDEDEDDEDEEMTVEEHLEEIEETLTDLNKATSGNKLKLGVDYRFALDNINYEMADGTLYKNDALMTNRLWINMNWKATDNLSFTGQLAYNSTFGQRSGASMGNQAEGFDWVTNENAYDDVVRVRSAYFFYKNDTFIGTEIPWTFSVGRRPSTNGHLINLRDDDRASSPMGHAINVEFDGLSSKFTLENVVGLEGMYVKLCAGRGMTNASPKFSAAPYSQNNDTTDIDMIGFIFAPYNDGKYGIATQYTYATNLIDVVDPMGTLNQGFKTVGDLETATMNFTMNGLGNDWNDYLEDSFFFLSGAMSVTHPNRNGGGMLGSTESKTGYSVWAGVQMPSVITEDGKWGLEYNQGSAYWRPITYAEDTNIGSKIAARGDAYEAYFTEPLVEDILTFQVRYTYIDYKYSGSNGFFGSAPGSAPMLIETTPSNQIVDKAQDIRFYLRYKY